MMTFLLQAVSRNLVFHIHCTTMHTSTRTTISIVGRTNGQDLQRLLAAQPSATYHPNESITSHGNHHLVGKQGADFPVLGQLMHGIGLIQCKLSLQAVHKLHLIIHLGCSLQVRFNSLKTKARTITTHFHCHATSYQKQCFADLARVVNGTFVSSKDS